MIDLRDEATQNFLHSGCALLVCTADAAGRPRACRAWGLTVVDAQRCLVRVLVEADDVVTIANLRAGGPIAVTATSVPTSQSMQLKGHAVSVDALTEADEAKRVQYTRDFVVDVHETDGYSMDQLDRSAQRRVVPCVIAVDSSFDQTPGPSAGAAIDRTNP